MRNILIFLPVLGRIIPIASIPEPLPVVAEEVQQNMRLTPIAMEVGVPIRIASIVERKHVVAGTVPILTDHIPMVIRTVTVIAVLTICPFSR